MTTLDCHAPSGSALYRIRDWRESDSTVALTSLLHRAYSKLGEMGLNYTAVDQTPQVTAQRIAGGNCFVVAFGDELVGAVVARPTGVDSECAYYNRSGVASAQQFAVDPAHQGRGIGRRLLAHAERWVAEREFTELALDTAGSAQHLIDFYSRLGYRPVDGVRWPGKTYRSVVLAKRLHGAVAVDPGASAA